MMKKHRLPAAVLAPIAAFCAAALAELVLLGAFAVNFAGYSNGYLSGADYFGLFVPWLAQSWEQNVYAGVGTSLAVVLAVFGIVCNARKAEKFFAAHRDWLIAGAVVLVLDLIAAGGNAITVNGKTLFTVPIPQFLMNFWAMFSSCARLAWLAGMLLAAVGCGLVLRFWDNGVAPALICLLCTICLPARITVSAVSLGKNPVFSNGIRIRISPERVPTRLFPCGSWHR